MDNVDGLENVNEQTGAGNESPVSSAAQALLSDQILRLEASVKLYSLSVMKTVKLRGRGSTLARNVYGSIWKTLIVRAGKADYEAILDRIGVDHKEFAKWAANPEDHKNIGEDISRRLEETMQVEPEEFDGFEAKFLHERESFLLPYINVIARHKIKSRKREQIADRQIGQSDVFDLIQDHDWQRDHDDSRSAKPDPRQVTGDPAWLVTVTARAKFSPDEHAVFVGKTGLGGQQQATETMIAEALGITEGQVKSIWRVVKKRLRLAIVAEYPNILAGIDEPGATILWLERKSKLRDTALNKQLQEHAETAEAAPWRPPDRHQQLRNWVDAFELIPVADRKSSIEQARERAHEHLGELFQIGDTD